MYFALTASTSSAQEEGDGIPESPDTCFTHTVSSGSVSAAKKQFSSGFDKGDVQDVINEDDEESAFKAYPQLHEEKVLFHRSKTRDRERLAKSYPHISLSVKATRFVNQGSWVRSRASPAFRIRF